MFNAVGVVFKGSGFYRTDSRKAPSEGGSSDGGEQAGPRQGEGGPERLRRLGLGSGSGSSGSAPAKESSSGGSSSSSSSSSSTGSKAASS